MRDLHFLFFVDREFHLAMFKEIIYTIQRMKLGDVAVFCRDYFPSSDGTRSKGARKETIDKYFSDYRFISNLDDYNADIIFTADSVYEEIENRGFIVDIGHGTICKGSFFY